MNKLVLAVVATMATASVASASVLPPRKTPPQVVTECGKPVAVYVYTKKGFAKYDGPVAVQMARALPYNLRIDAGCK